MIEIIFDWLKGNCPILFLLLAVAVVVTVIVWIVAKFYFQRFKKIEDTVSQLPCSAHMEEMRDIKKSVSRLETKVSQVETKVSQVEMKVSQVEETVSQMETKVSKIDSICEQLSEITKWIMKRDPREIETLAPKFSPRRMSTAGLNLYDISGAKAVVDGSEEALVKAIHAEKPQTPLDVEDEAYTVLAGKLSEPIFNGVKNYIYYQPEKVTVKGDGDEEVTVTLSLILLLRLMSIDLRDRYLAKYPIQQSDSQQP